ncbi:MULTISPECIES: metal ABC transporter permease [Terrabacteria group]|uniref:metal ABC transporter permease n=1 Tax=Bacillati TaxID=1783272 RepID=UPI0019393FCC|nr:MULTISPECIES: metal ABC transporter permease [Terrabacteria group]MBW9212998.1 metal ABC transporter permease [Trueperella sp. zg.1013]QRG87040.1 metal ABC transporter permease [Bulleidia sp. zg-1006]
MNTLLLYLSYPFVQYAFIVTICVSLCASLLGVTLVLKRYSHIGDGLSHVAFGAMTVAAVTGLTNDIWITLPCTTLAAVILLSGRTKMKGDAGMALVSVSSLGMGYLIMNVFSKRANLSGDVCASLFGATSILTLSLEKVVLSLVLSVLLILLFVYLHHRIFALTFDEGFVKATGFNTKLYNLLIAVLISLVIVLAMNLVGSLLISALIIFPALSAMRLYHSFKAVTICSTVLSVLCSISGLVLSILLGSPVGSTIVLMDMIVFIGIWLWEKVEAKR